MKKKRDDNRLEKLGRLVPSQQAEEHRKYIEETARCVTSSLPERIIALDGCRTLTCQYVNGKALMAVTTVHQEFSMNLWCIPKTDVFIYTSLSFNIPYI